jgi:hypothetical protein
MLRRAGQIVESASRAQLVGILAVVFLATRAGYFALGVRFNDYPLSVYWQYLPVRLLRTRLLESLAYLHSQPPLFNLYLGAVLKAAGAHQALLFHLLSAGFGLGVLFGSLLLMRRLGVSRTKATLLALVFTTSPAFVAYENWLFYSLPMAFVLLASALLLERFLRAGSTAWGSAFFAALLVAGASRSLFHWIWFATVAAGLAVLAPRLRRPVLLSAALPFCLLLALYGKNALLFGRFSASSWMGMNLARMTVGELSQERRDALVASGRLSEVSRVVPFSPPEAYPKELFVVPPRFGHVPALSQLEKGRSATNFNHHGYLEVSERYQADALRLMREEPGLYLAAVRDAWGIYLRSPSSLKFLGVDNRRTLATLFDAYDYALFGRVPWVGFPRGERGEADFTGAVYLGLVLGLPAVFAFGVAAALGRLGTRLTEAQRLVTAYVCFDIAWVAAVGNLIELGENNRFRFETDPLSLVLLGMALQRLLRRG